MGEIIGFRSRSKCPDCGVPVGATHGQFCDLAWCEVCDDQRSSCSCGDSEDNWDAVWDGFDWLGVSAN